MVNDKVVPKSWFETLPSKSICYNKKLKWYLSMSAEQETEQERRITFCLYESWEKIAGSSSLPALKKLQRQEIEAFKSNLVLLDLRSGKDNPTFQVIGNGLTEDLEVDLIGRPLAEVPRRSMLSRVTDHYLEVLANRVPIAFEAEFINRDGEKALYRGILLPFSDDNQNINFILGGVRWILAKDVQLDEDKPTIEELMRTIAAGRDDITFENDSETTSSEDELEETTAEETEIAIKDEEPNNLESIPTEEKVVLEDQPIDEASEMAFIEEPAASEEGVPAALETILEEDNSQELNKGNLVEDDLTTNDQEVALEEYIDIKPDPFEATEAIAEEISFETNDGALQEKEDTETIIDDGESIVIDSISSEEDIISEEKIIFEEPDENAEPIPVTEKDYIEVDETTSFEEDIIEELTANHEQETSIYEEHDLTENYVSQEPLEKTEAFNSDAETADSHEEISIAEADKPAQEEPPIKEKLKKRERKGSVIERSMEMLLGKSKKKDIFGHEIRSAESKITLPTQPDHDEEPDIIAVQEEVDFDENETRLVTSEEMTDPENSVYEIDENDANEEKSFSITENIEIPSNTVNVSFEDEINKVLKDTLDEISIEKPPLSEENPLVEENSNETVSPEEEIILDVYSEITVNQPEIKTHDVNELILEEEIDNDEPQSILASEEVISTENIEEVTDPSSLNLENEIPEEIAVQEEVNIILSPEETAQASISLEEDINIESSINDENEEITLDVTEAEDIIDDKIIMEQQVESSEPVLAEPNTNHDIVDHKEEKSDEQSLHELQDSLKQIVRYIKKEDSSHNRSRDSLYNILTAIYKFHSVCENSPDAYNALVAENSLKIQERAPFTPVLKICLGKNYDKTRLTEYAAALGIAKHMNVEVDDFHDFIKHFPGGIKGCVKEMRAIRKGSNGANLIQQTRTVEEARNILRDMPVIGRIRLKKMIVSKDADEFCLLLAKRRGHDIDVLKVLDDQYTKIDPILKRAAFIKGNLKKEN